VSISLEENSLTAAQFLDIRHSVGWIGNEEQIKRALDNGLFSVAVKDVQQIVGMGRLIGDGAMYWYIQDVVVKPDYQCRGIGKTIMNRLFRYVIENSLPGSTVSVYLMSVKGKEEFYRKLGFTERPSDLYGAGMIKQYQIPMRADS
jgi:ribosomal protein S18 acetylase RimI-like enzyme